MFSVESLGQICLMQMSKMFPLRVIDFKAVSMYLCDFVSSGPLCTMFVTCNREDREV